MGGQRAVRVVAAAAPPGPRCRAARSAAPRPRREHRERRVAPQHGALAGAVGRRPPGGGPRRSPARTSAATRASQSGLIVSRARCGALGREGPEDDAEARARCRRAARRAGRRSRRAARAAPRAARGSPWPARRSAGPATTCRRTSPASTSAKPASVRADEHAVALAAYGRGVVSMAARRNSDLPLPRRDEREQEHAERSRDEAGDQHARRAGTASRRSRPARRPAPRPGGPAVATKSRSSWVRRVVAHQRAATGARCRSRPAPAPARAAPASGPRRGRPSAPARSRRSSPSSRRSAAPSTTVTNASTSTMTPRAASTENAVERMSSATPPSSSMPENALIAPPPARPPGRSGPGHHVGVAQARRPRRRLDLDLLREAAHVAAEPQDAAHRQPARVAQRHARRSAPAARAAPCPPAARR